jgi:hypothetical protein
LGDRVLFEEISDERGDETKSEEVSGRLEILFGHCKREIQDNNQVADYSPLKGCCVP